jgi:hypothetical protein
MVNTFKIFLEEQRTGGCPPATKDISINLENRQKAIDEYGYGPANPNDEEADNDMFWQEKADMWNCSVENVKTMRCENCAAFDVSDKMRACIENGLVKEPGTNKMETIEVADLGYCNFLHFKCAGQRTCDAWVAGGAIDK